MEYYSLLKIIVSNLKFIKTYIEIIKILLSKKGGLLNSDIICHIRHSERNIRKLLKMLLIIVILKRKIEVLDNKLLAYRHSIES
jgi:hypothetical protein